MTTLTDALLDPILAADPAGPRITWYDDAAGARIELSAVTLANWAAKTANMIRDEFGLLPGGRVAVLLPAHWQTAAVLLGAWWAGADVVLDADPDAELALATADRLDDVADVAEVAALSLDAFGMPVPNLPVGVTDYATHVRMHGDQFRSSGDAGAALDGRSSAEILSAARESASSSGIGSGDRVLSGREWSTADDLISGLLAVLAAGASLVQVSNPDADATERRVATEKITVRLD
ncbi:TIGR03089 family protein [Rhodococcus sp. HM1]|uniref:TIGR03089 family protein n=1 Tax=unclassified Rhodococcus (in: high G+C Gram-positive bacteria) TaxID=192944 RepID=UPI0018CDB0DC|nr:MULTISPECIES: TIGR03089 family protein [unclassified Rhodococcus (in: high G+C Gram-positive bacteria)]MBH0121187.1 TIGR03089 family protein [Rhodococcus sp. CX]MCK8670054.1 TIGR03089 family protein [Rhodococcus sp. HM1]